MTINEVISALDDEISRLRQARELLVDLEGSGSSGAKIKGLSSSLPAHGASELPVKRGPGRPKGSTNKAAGIHGADSTPKRRTMSPEGKERIAAAQRTRWAKQNGNSSAGSSKSSAPERGVSAAGKRSSASTRAIPGGAASKSAPLKKAASGRKSVSTSGSASLTKRTIATPSLQRFGASKKDMSRSAPANKVTANDSSESDAAMRSQSAHAISTEAGKV